MTFAAARLIYTPLGSTWASGVGGTGSGEWSGVVPKRSPMIDTVRVQEDNRMEGNKKDSVNLKATVL